MQALWLRFRICPGFPSPAGEFFREQLKTTDGREGNETRLQVKNTTGSANASEAAGPTAGEAAVDGISRRAITPACVLMK